MMENRIYNARPMTLYVTPDGISNVSLEHIGVEAERIIDVEVTKEDAKKLLALLEDKLETNPTIGSVTFRLRGRLII